MPRVKVPTEILKLTGSKHLKYEASKKRAKEPKPEPVAPKMPVKLSADGKKYWRWFVPKMVKLGIISQDNRETLKRYCALMAMWDELYEDVQKNGVSQMSPNTGTSSMRAEYRSMMQIGEECRRLETEFGLTPSSRTKIEAITAPEKATDDPKEKYFA